MSETIDGQRYYNTGDVLASGTEDPDVQRLIRQVVNLQAENEELIRQLSIHRKGECIKAFCFECNKNYWYVDDEIITCPYCNKEQDLEDILEDR